MRTLRGATKVNPFARPLNTTLLASRRPGRLGRTKFRMQRVLDKAASTDRRPPWLLGRENTEPNQFLHDHRPYRIRDACARSNRILLAHFHFLDWMKTH